MDGAAGVQNTSLCERAEPPLSCGAMPEPQKPPIQAIVAPVTPLQQNCTIVWCTKTRKAAVIDPGGEVQRLLAILKDQNLTLEKIWVTHGHMDHDGGVAGLKAG